MKTTWYKMLTKTANALDKNNENAKLFFNVNTNVNSKEEIILRIVINNALFFDSHIKKVCQNATQKLAVLFRLTNYLEPEKKENLFSISR